MNKTAVEITFSDEVKAEIDKWIAKFPADQKQSACLRALTVVQEANNNMLTEALMDQVAAYLDMPKIAVYEVATFYTMYNHKPVGKYKIEVCTNLSCTLCGANEVVNHLEKRLGVKMGGEVTSDGKYSLHQAECLGACVGAPMLQIGDKYYEKLSSDEIDKLLEELN